MATAAFVEPDAGNARNGGPLTEGETLLGQSGRALLDDLKGAEIRHENVMPSKALAEVSQPSTGLDALKAEENFFVYEML